MHLKESLSELHLPFLNNNNNTFNDTTINITTEVGVDSRSFFATYVIIEAT